MEVKDLIPVSWSNQRILITAQLAGKYGCQSTHIRDNFRKAKEYFKEGEHYFKLVGEDLRTFKRYAERIGLAVNPFANTLYLWTYQGCARHCKMLNTPNALEVLEELRTNYFEVQTPQIVEIKGVRCYLDDKGDAHINAEDAARGLGFVMVRRERVTESCDSPYTAVRWNTVNNYLRDMGCLKEGDADIKSGDYISETWFYLLAMKASNETAKKFQWKVANEVMPSIRKYGYYVDATEAVEAAEAAPKEEVIDRLKKQIAKPCADLAVVYALLMGDGTVKIGMTKDLTVRIKILKAETKLDVLDFRSTRFMPREDAVILEAALKEKFAEYSLGGEYFDMRFIDLAAEL